MLSNVAVVLPCQLVAASKFPQFGNSRERMRTPNPLGGPNPSNGEISGTMRFLVVSLVPLENSLWGMHGLCFVAFKPTVWKLSNFKAFKN